MRKHNLLNLLSLSLCLLVLSSSTVLGQDFCNGDFTYDGDVDGDDVTEFLNHFGRGQYDRPCPPDGPAPVAKTGQTTSYYMGDDGSLEPGVELPTNPRLEDPGDLIVIDHLTGLMWLYNANCMGSIYPEWDNLGVSGDGKVPWENALNFVSQINNGWYPLCQGGNPKYTDWRLPTIKELQSLIHHGYFNPALPNTTGTGQWVENDPFNLVQSDYYWSSTTYAGYTDYAWFLNMDVGDAGVITKDFYGYVWPVRGGKGGLPPRFTNNGDGTVTDNDSGLVWLKDANCSDFFGGVSWDVATTIVGGLANGNCGLTDGSNPGDWRIPTVEMTELLQCSEYMNPCLCNTSGSGQASNGDPFSNVQFGLGDVYWTSTPGPNPNSRVLENFDNASISAHGDETTPQFVWPVRNP